jgi:hypothetical protein
MYAVFRCLRVRAQLPPTCVRWLAGSYVYVRSPRVFAPSV